MTLNVFRNIDGCIRTVLPKRPLVPSQPKTLSPKYPPTSIPLPFLQKPLHFSPQATKNQTPIFSPSLPSHSIILPLLIVLSGTFTAPLINPFLNIFAFESYQTLPRVYGIIIITSTDLYFY